MSKVSDEQIEAVARAIARRYRPRFPDETDVATIDAWVESNWRMQTEDARLFLTAALEAVSSIHEAEPEPVAWRYRATYLGDGSPVLGWQFSEEASLLGLYEPLYAHPAPISKGVTATHRHKKRGSEYVLIGIGKMQAELWFDHTTYEKRGLSFPRNVTVDMREVAIYRSVDDDALWVRPIEEFNDGRFEALSHTAGETD